MKESKPHFNGSDKQEPHAMDSLLHYTQLPAFCVGIVHVLCLVQCLNFFLFVLFQCIHVAINIFDQSIKIRVRSAAGFGLSRLFKKRVVRLKDEY